jgi:hypothetical protein
MSEHKALQDSIQTSDGVLDPLESLVANKDLQNNIPSPGTSTSKAVDSKTTDSEKQDRNDTQLDLSSVSIENNNVIRVSEKPQLRRPRGNNQSLSQNHRPSPAKTATGRPPEAYGVFKNPLFKYEGGLANRIISFLANVLKAIEQIILRLLGKRDTGILFAPNLQTPVSKSTSSSEKDKEKRRSKKLEAKQQALTVKRS